MDFTSYFVRVCVCVFWSSTAAVVIQQQEHTQKCGNARTPSTPGSRDDKAKTKATSVTLDQAATVIQVKLNSYTCSSSAAILYTLKCIFIVYTFWTALSLRKYSQQILPHAPPAVTSEPGSWQMLATLASAVILIRSHHTRSCMGNIELASSHLLITHAHNKPAAITHGSSSLLNTGSSSKPWRFAPFQKLTGQQIWASVTDTTLERSFRLLSMTCSVIWIK